MKGMIKVIAIGTAITICLGCVTVFGKDGFNKGKRRITPPTSVQTQFKKFNDFKRPMKKELTEEEKTARLNEMKAELAQKLSAGEISQEQYDKIIDKFENGKGMPRGHFDKGPIGKKPEMKELTEEQKTKLEEMKANFKDSKGIPKGHFGKGPMGKKPESKELTEEEKAKLKEMKANFKKVKFSRGDSETK